RRRDRRARVPPARNRAEGRCRAGSAGAGDEGRVGRLSEHEFVLDTPTLRGFVDHVRAVVDSARSPQEACDAIRPRFAELLADRDWLPATYRADAPESGMGGGIGQWLL